MAGDTVGRKKKEVTPELIEQVELLAACGLLQYQIAEAIDMCEATFYDRIKTNPELEIAMRRGQSKGIAKVANALFDAAISGDVSACRYYLNNRDKENWRDRVESTITGPDGGPVQVQEITFVPVGPDNKTNI